MYTFDKSPVFAGDYREREREREREKEKERESEIKIIYYFVS